MGRLLDRHNDPADLTVLHDRHLDDPDYERLTNGFDPHPFESLQERLTYSARLAPEKRLNVHINPLVAAANELLVQLSRLTVAPPVGDILALNRTLIEQVKLFEAQAHHHSIVHDQMLAARYVLCTVLDEAVLRTPWGSASNWSTLSLLSHFHKETFGGEKFFQLLGRLGANPARHLYLLELMYLCMALGFEGKYHASHRGKDELDGIRDGLHRQIRQLRGDVSSTLSPHWRGSLSAHAQPVRRIPLWRVGMVTLLTLAVMYSGFAWVLGKQRETVLKPYQAVDSATSRIQPKTEMHHENTF